MCFCLSFSFGDVELEKMNRLSSDHLKRVMQDNLKLREVLESKKKEAEKTNQKVLFLFSSPLFIFSHFLKALHFLSYCRREIYFSSYIEETGSNKVAKCPLLLSCFFSNEYSWIA